MKHHGEANAASHSTSPAVTNRWPSQIKYIVGNEACERFSYYGMKGILALYIINVLMKTQDDATSIIALFSVGNYLMPMFGAWVADRYWGRYKTILWISLFYCAGHAVLATSDLFQSVDAKVAALYGGLALIAFGSGGIKPCVAAFMGDQFKPDQRHLLQKAYAAFYFSINLGSFLSFLIIPAIRKTWGYGWAFGVPGIFMAVATLVFWLGTKHYVMHPPSRKARHAGFFRVFWEALRNRHVRKPGESFWAPAAARFSPQEVEAASSVGPILSIFAMIPTFWALFDQTYSTWVIQGERMIPYNLGGWMIGPEEMLSANPLLVMILIPIMTLGLYPLLGRLATPLKRMTFGMFLAGASYLVVAALQSRLEAGVQLSILWQIAPYTVLTVAEVLVSTTGLEFAFREAAPQMKSIILGFWSLTASVGNLLVVVITRLLSGSGTSGHDASVTTSRFLLYAGISFAVAVVFAIVASRYKYRDASAAQGK